MSKSKTLISIMLIVSMLFIFTACAEIEETATTDDAATETTETNDPGISKAEFNKLKTGMTYEEAVKIIGGNGDVMSESGTPGGTGMDIHIVMYTFEGESGLGANANLTFQDNKLENKAQFGLE